MAKAKQSNNGSVSEPSSKRDLKLDVVNEGADKTLAIVPSVHAALVKLGCDVSAIIASHKSAVAAGLVSEAGKMSRKGTTATGYTFKGEKRELADSALNDKQDVACRFAVWHDAVRSIFTRTINGTKVGEFDFSLPRSLAEVLTLTFPAKAKAKAKAKTKQPELTAPVKAE